MLLLRVITVLLVQGLLAGAIPTPDINSLSNDTLVARSDSHGCGWSHYDKYWHGRPEYGGENLVALPCWTPKHPFRDFSILCHCMCYFFTEKDCKGGWSGGDHPQKWGGEKGELWPRAKSYWCDWPQDKCDFC